MSAGRSVEGSDDVHTSWEKIPTGFEAGSFWDVREKARIIWSSFIKDEVEVGSACYDVLTSLMFRAFEAGTKHVASVAGLNAHQSELFLAYVSEIENDGLECSPDGIRGLLDAAKNSPEIETHSGILAAAGL